MKFKNVDRRRLVLVVISVIVMGFALSFLNMTRLGTDPFTVFNLGMSAKLNLSFGNWQALFNSALFIFVILFARNQIGWGTLANMFLVGYSFDFFTWLNSFWLSPGYFDSIAVRVLVMVPALTIFTIAAATYMACDLGTSPYDAMAFILSDVFKKVPFRLVRIGYDLTVCVIGILLGGEVGIVTILMSFALGPLITLIKEKYIDKYLK